MNKVDIGIFIIVLIFMAAGYYKGLLMSILSALQYFVVIFLAIHFSPMLSETLIKKFNLDVIIIEWAKNNVSLISDNIGIISEEILQNVSGRIINVLAVIILFIIFKIICSLIVAVLNKIANLPILSLANKFGGLILGAINGILVVYIFILLVNWMPFASLDILRSEIASSFLGTAINSFVPEVATEVISMVKLSD